VGSPDGLTVDKLISMLQPIMRIGFTAHQASLTMVTLHRKNKEHLIAFLQRVLNAKNSLNKGLSEDAVSAGEPTPDTPLRFSLPSSLMKCSCLKLEGRR
jgi:hypothetical protein